MKSNISRRSVLGGLAAATAGMTSCVRANQVLGQVNLICHGMMMFYWDGSSSFIKILLPKPPLGTTNPPHEAHKILFSEWLGGGANEDHNRLFTPGDYQLQLTTSADQGAFKPNPDYDVVLDSRTIDRTKLLQLAGGHRYSITIPFTSQVVPYRQATFSRCPYCYKGAGMDFKLANKIITGVHVFTYSQVTAPPVLLYNNQYPQQLGPDGQPNSLNLYLYSEPDMVVDMKGAHLRCFNDLAQYAGMDGQYKGLDLEAVSGLEATTLQPPKAYKDLTADDLKSLVELRTGPIASTGERVPRLDDPVECLQGWGT